MKNLYLRQHQVDHHHKWIMILLFAILVGCVNAETGYRCYTCISNANDLSCLNDPSHVTSGSTSVACDQENGEFGWCQIVRQEYVEIPGSIVSFGRYCHKTQPSLVDEVITDDTHTFFYRTCRSHLCNIGDGLESFGAAAGGSGPGNSAGDIIFVNPETNLSISIHSTTSLIPLVALSTFILMTYNFIRTVN